MVGRREPMTNHESRKPKTIRSPKTKSTALENADVAAGGKPIREARPGGRANSQARGPRYHENYETNPKVDFRSDASKMAYENRVPFWREKRTQKKPKLAGIPDYRGEGKRKRELVGGALPRRRYEADNVALSKRQAES